MMAIARDLAPPLKAALDATSGSEARVDWRARAIRKWKHAPEAARDPEVTLGAFRRLHCDTHSPSLGALSSAPELPPPNQISLFPGIEPNPNGISTRAGICRAIRHDRQRRQPQWALEIQQKEKHYDENRIWRRAGAVLAGIFWQASWRWQARMDAAYSSSPAPIVPAATRSWYSGWIQTGTPSLTWVDTLQTGGNGGAGGNAGILQFRDGLGAVANFGSNSVSQLVRYGRFIAVGRTLKLAQGAQTPIQSH